MAEPATGKHRRDRNQPAALSVQAAGQAARPALFPRPGGASPGNPAPPELMVSRDTQLAGPSVLANAPPPPIALEQPRPAPKLAEPPVAAPPPARLAAALPRVAAPVIQPLAPHATPRPSVAQYAPPPAAAEPVFNLAPGPKPPVAAPAARPSFSQAFAEMSPVIVDITPERGAVDLRKIKPARAIPPPPPPPSHPSRIWVELGVGRDPDRMAFDWRRMIKDDPEIFRGKTPFVTGWARTNRLLVGPFETDKAANAFAEKLHKADHASAFVWTSPAGQVVDPLDGT